MSERDVTDRGIGFAVLFGLLAVAGAVAVYATPTQAQQAWGFSAVIVFGCLLIVVQQYYG